MTILDHLTTWLTGMLLGIGALLMAENSRRSRLGTVLFCAGAIALWVLILMALESQP